MKARSVKAGKPHVTHEHDLERIKGVAKAVRQRLTSRLVADVRLPIGGVGCGTGHHDLDGSFIVVFVLPAGTQTHQFTVEIDANAPTHAHNHCLAFKNFEALLKMLDDIFDNKP